MNNQLTHVAWQKILKKSIIWTLWLFVLALFQTTVLAEHRIFGAVPDIVLSAIVTIALFDGERTGTISGITGGIIIDALGGVKLSLSPFVYMVCGLIIALLTYYFLRSDFMSWLVSGACAFAFCGAASLINMYSSVNTAFISSSMVWTEVLIPQFFASLLAGIPVFFLTKLIWGKLFDNREMES